jgi:hypothetical protein
LRSSRRLAWYVWNQQERDREIQLIQSLRRVAERVRRQSIPDGELYWELELQRGGPTFIRRLAADLPFQAFDRVIQCDFLNEVPEFAPSFAISEC